MCSTVILEEKSEKIDDKSFEKEITIKSRSQNNEVIIEVSDSGTGVSDAIKENNEGMAIKYFDAAIKWTPMSRQFFAQFKRQIRMIFSRKFNPNLTTVFDLPHTPAEVEVRSENGPPKRHVGGVDFCRSGFKNIFIIPPTSTDFHHNIFQLEFAPYSPGEDACGCKNQSIFSRTYAAAQRIEIRLRKFLHTSHCAIVFR